MSPETRTDIVEILEKSRQEFLEAAHGVSEAQAKINPEPGRWSVLDCVEHVTLVEQRFLGRLEAASPVDAPDASAEKEAALTAAVPDRSRRAEAPEFVRPAGRFATLAEALEHFNAARAQTIRFAQERANDLYSLATEHARFGPLNGKEQLLISAGHVRRHAAQIREVRAAIGVS